MGSRISTTTIGRRAEIPQFWEEGGLADRIGCCRHDSERIPRLPSSSRPSLSSRRRAGRRCKSPYRPQPFVLRREESSPSRTRRSISRCPYTEARGALGVDFPACATASLVDLDQDRPGTAGFQRPPGRSGGHAQPGRAFPWRPVGYPMYRAPESPLLARGCGAALQFSPVSPTASMQRRASVVGLDQALRGVEAARDGQAWWAPIHNGLRSGGCSQASRDGVRLGGLDR